MNFIIKASLHDEKDLRIGTLFDTILILSKNGIGLKELKSIKDPNMFHKSFIYGMVPGKSRKAFMTFFSYIIAL